VTNRHATGLRQLEREREREKNEKRRQRERELFGRQCALYKGILTQCMFVVLFQTWVKYYTPSPQRKVLKSPKPALVASIGSCVVQIAAGQAHAAAVDEEGLLRTWGR
jgi:hypothetical protein